MSEQQCDIGKYPTNLEEQTYFAPGIGFCPMEKHMTAVKTGLAPVSLDVFQCYDQFYLRISNTIGKYPTNVGASK